jgi:hypothetical protein
MRTNLEKKTIINITGVLYEAIIKNNNKNLNMLCPPFGKTSGKIVVYLKFKRELEGYEYSLENKLIICKIQIRGRKH